MQSSNFTQYLGNPNLNPQKSSTTYEIGLQQQLGEFIGIDLTAYYRDLQALIGTTLYEARTGGDTWGRYENTDFGRVRGISLTEIRTYMGLLGSLSYTYQLALGNASDPKQAFYDAQQNNESSRNLVALDWDQTHNVSTTLSYVRNKLEHGSYISMFYTGYPFTPQDIQRNRIELLRNQARYNAEFLLDLELLMSSLLLD